MQLDKTSRFTEVLKDENVSDYSIYGILLFDIWTENKAEKSYIINGANFVIQAILPVKNL